MKCLSLWQPWASAVVLGAKKIETRSWPTRYRGTLLIHAAKRQVDHEFSHLLSCWNWNQVFEKFGGTMSNRITVERFISFGAIIGQVELVDCQRTDDIKASDIKRVFGTFSVMEFTEESLGDFSLGRFGWFFENPVRFNKPIPYRGRQGLFEVAINKLDPRFTTMITHIERIVETGRGRPGCS